MKEHLKKTVTNIERVLPMSLVGFFMFAITIYLFILVGRSIWQNYNSNKILDVKATANLELEAELAFMQDQINYYQTSSFKEKEAREKLGYKAAGENVMALPLDQLEEGNTEVENGEPKIKTPNYRLWWEFLFG